MLNMNQKFEEAKVKYEAALTKLKECREAYDNGPQKEYAETATNLSELQDLIRQDEVGLENSKARLALELQASNGRTTDAAKNLLRDRRDMEELLEQRHLVQQEVEKRLEDLREPVSKAAFAYKTAYHYAAECWWKVQTYDFLAEHGQRLCELMSILHSDQSPRMYDSDRFRDDTLPKNILRKEINSMVDTFEGDQMPYRSEIGKFDMKAFPSEKILTAAEKNFNKYKNLSR